MTSLMLMPNPTGAAPDAPRAGEESLAPAVAAYSPSNVISTMDEHPMLDPVVYSWHDCSSAGSEEDTDTPRPPTAVDGHVSGPQLLVAATGLDLGRG
jgi:E3 ubiquitin-protein ligase RNF5